MKLVIIICVQLFSQELWTKYIDIYLQQNSKICTFFPEIYFFNFDLHDFQVIKNIKTSETQFTL